MELENKEKVPNGSQNPSNVNTSLEPVFETVIKDGEDSLDSSPKKKKRWHQQKMSLLTARKGVSQGMMDIALLTANANQLRFQLELSPRNANFYIAVILISISILLQIGVGIILLVKPTDRLKSKSAHAQMLKQLIVAGVFLITIMNVMIAAFSTPQIPAVNPAIIPAQPV